MSTCCTYLSSFGDWIQSSVQACIGTQIQEGLLDDWKALEHRELSKFDQDDVTRLQSVFINDYAVIDKYEEKAVENINKRIPVRDWKDYVHSLSKWVDLPEEVKKELKQLSDSSVWPPYFVYEKSEKVESTKAKYFVVFAVRNGDELNCGYLENKVFLKARPSHSEEQDAAQIQRLCQHEALTLVEKVTRKHMITYC